MLLSLDKVDDAEDEEEIEQETTAVEKPDPPLNTEDSMEE